MLMHTGGLMTFVKLHQDGRELLVNLCNVSDVYQESGNNKSRLFFNFAAGGDQVNFPVDESIDEILELIKQVSA